MNTISIRRGSTLPLTINLDESGVSDVKLVIKETVSDSEPILLKSAIITDNVASILLTAEDTQIDPATYIYQITVSYTDGTVEKYPEATSYFDEDLYDSPEDEFPKFVVLESLDN